MPNSNRANGRPQPVSYLDTLQQAKQLFLKENFNAAKILFDDVGRIAFATAPDLWIDAMYGLAECQRLERDFLNAAKTYEKLLRFGSSRTNIKGRFEESNCIAIIQSFLGIFDIGRLSLHVLTPDLEEFLAYGFRWTSNEVDEETASRAFGLARLLLKRNLIGPESVLDDMAILLDKLQGANYQWLSDYDVVVKLKLFETKLDVRLPDEPPILPPYDHPAYHWASTFNRLLCARRSLLLGDFDSTRISLADVAEDAESFRLYPELFLPRLALSSEMALKHDSIDDSILNYWEKIQQDITHALQQLGDLSTPFWHLNNLLRLQIKKTQRTNTELVGHERTHRTLLSQSLALLQVLLDTPWLRDVLLSRNITHSSIKLIRRWSQEKEYSNTWYKDGNTLLEILTKAVRP
jgi:hypothetical protein